jgi:hypothetical protein
MNVDGADGHRATQLLRSHSAAREKPADRALPRRRGVAMTNMEERPNAM